MIQITNVIDMNPSKYVYIYVQSNIKSIFEKDKKKMIVTTPPTCETPASSCTYIDDKEEEERERERESSSERESEREREKFSIVLLLYLKLISIYTSLSSSSPLLRFFFFVIKYHPPFPLSHREDVYAYILNATHL